MEYQANLQKDRIIIIRHFRIVLTAKRPINLNIMKFVILCVLFLWLTGFAVAEESVKADSEESKPTFNEDYNFDGHPDKKVFDSKGGGRYAVNEQFNIFLFNPKTKTYEFHERLSLFCNPYPDPKTKKVHSSGRNGAMGGEHEVYIWKESELVLIERTIIKDNNETEEIITTAEKLIDGKMTEVSRNVENYQEKQKRMVWADPEVALREDADFSIQGEYGSVKEGELAHGVQVVALGGGLFDAYLLERGLPGLGWNPNKPRTLLKGETKDDKIVFENTDKLIIATISDGKWTMTDMDGKQSVLPRIERKSPTMGATAPEGAVVLFDGSSAEAWEKGKIENGLLAAGCTSKQLFGSYRLHLEFRTPYRPADRGQKRGNSGIYHSGRYETQILDSFGLETKDNECGGIYSISKPRLNMCLPPLVWQTYDVDFTAAKFDTEGKRTAWPRITVRLNGELIHDDLELGKDFTTSAPISTPLVDSNGPVYLQDHQNPVFFRNIWIVPVKD
jgi:hypothetical protein